ncbi:hypothetical protein FRB95_003359 [Tulasnella sp. JGI-2019a]|nr:hypothetical protein FRB95_003359 [Tulasnella sp. JGI-2019a]
MARRGLYHRHITGQLQPSFWPWLESQRNMREIELHWSCDPYSIPTLTLPKLEALGATPEVAKILVPNRSIRAFDGIGNIRDTASPTWSLEDLEHVLPHLGTGLQSIGGVKVMRQHVGSFLRLVRKWCPFTKTLHFLIDFEDFSISNAPGVIDPEDLVSALRGFKCLRNLYLTVDYELTEGSVREMIKEIAKDCPTLSFVKWTSTVSDDLHRNYAFKEFRCELIDGLWSRVEPLSDDEYPVAYRGPESWQPSLPVHLNDNPFLILKSTVLKYQVIPCAKRSFCEIINFCSERPAILYSDHLIRWVYFRILAFSGPENIQKNESMANIGWWVRVGPPLSRLDGSRCLITLFSALLTQQTTFVVIQPRCPPLSRKLVTYPLDFSRRLGILRLRSEAGMAGCGRGAVEPMTEKLLS